MIIMMLLVCFFLISSHISRFCTHVTVLKQRNQKCYLEISMLCVGLSVLSFLISPLPHLMLTLLHLLSSEETQLHHRL